MNNIDEFANLIGGKTNRDEKCYPLTNSQWQELSLIAQFCEQLLERLKLEHELKADDEFIDGENHTWGETPDYTNLVCLKEITDKLCDLEEQWKHCQG